MFDSYPHPRALYKLDPLFDNLITLFIVPDLKFTTKITRLPIMHEQ